jgi:hypothetical protein
MSSVLGTTRRRFNGSLFRQELPSTPCELLGSAGVAGTSCQPTREHFSIKKNRNKYGTSSDNVVGMRDAKPTITRLMTVAGLQSGFAKFALRERRHRSASCSCITA